MHLIKNSLKILIYNKENKQIHQYIKNWINSFKTINKTITEISNDRKFFAAKISNW